MKAFASFLFVVSLAWAGGATADVAPPPTDVGTRHCDPGPCLPSPTGGETAVTLLATGGYPASIAVNSRDVFWTNSYKGGSVMKVPRAGGTPITLAAADGPFGIAVDETSVYFTEDGRAPKSGRILKLPLSGGALTELASNLDSPRGIAVDRERVYFTLNTAHGQVMSVPKRGGTAQVIASDQEGPLGIAVDAMHVYWQTAATPSHQGTIARAPRAGGLMETLSAAEDASYGIALDPSNVYWANSGSGTVMTVPKRGGTPRALAFGQHHPRGIAVDATRVYWTNFVGPGEVMSVPREGGTPAVHAAGQDVPQGIAVDETSVYWVNYVGQGSVMKAPKTPTAVSVTSPAPDPMKLLGCWGVDSGPDHGMRVSFKVANSTPEDTSSGVLQASISWETVHGRRPGGSTYQVQHVLDKAEPQRVAVFSGSHFDLQLDTGAALVKGATRGHLNAENQGQHISEDVLCDFRPR